MTKKELTDQAKSKVENNPDEAIMMYAQVWQDFYEEFNGWDAMSFFKASRKTNQVNEDLEVQLMERFGEDQRIQGLFLWLQHDRFRLALAQNDINRAEQLIESIITYGEQKNRKEDDAYPCPYTICVLKMAEYFKKPNFNVQKIRNLLNAIYPEMLSDKEIQYTSDDGKERVQASDLERFYMLEIKCLYKEGRFDECIKTADITLQEVKKLHYDNNIWFNRLKALSLMGKGEVDSAENILEKLLDNPSGQKWFIYKEIAKIFFDEEQYETALKNACEAALMGSDYEKKIDLFILLARILIKLNRKEEAETNARLLISILKREEFNVKDKHRKMMNYFNFSIDEDLNFKELLNQAKSKWEEVKWKEFTSEEGVVTKIHTNGKSGFIKSVKGEVFFFSKTSLQKRIKGLEELYNAKVSFKTNLSNNLAHGEKRHALHIRVIASAKVSSNNVKVGKTYEGTIKKIMNFGLFVTIQPRVDGLVHISNINGARGGNELNSWFKQGQTVKVKVRRITDKGIDLVIA